MKHTFLYRLAGTILFIGFLSSCSTTRQSAIPFSGSIEGVRVIKPSDSKRVASSFIGPCPSEDDLLLIENKITDKNLEKGGKRTYIPPGYTTIKPEIGITVYSEAELMQQAIVLKQYAVENNYDTEYAFLINMSLKSGKKRFYVVNLKSMTIENSALVAHGRGDERFTFEKEFSNAPGSNCTSLGRYKVGKSYTGQFGLAFKLNGLDNSNNNAYKRFVVLHAMGCISYEETDMPICQSEGCPAVSPQFLEEIKPLIDGRVKPMLLWIFDSNPTSKLKK